MWSSFTKDEKKLFVFLASMLAVGSVLTPLIDSTRHKEVFPAGGNVSASVPPQGSRGGVRAPDSQTGRGPKAFPDGRIDINAASREVLESLPGIGPSRAAAIVEYRSQNGGFRIADDIKKVHGIGPGIFSRLEPLIGVGADQLTSSVQIAQASQPTVFAGATTYQVGSVAGVGGGGSPVQPTPGVVKAPEGNGPVNINTASLEELKQLKHIGDVLARRIIDYRTQHGPFQTVEMLDKVQGIGPKAINANRNRIILR
jgi:competence protein ComEA